MLETFFLVSLSFKKKKAVIRHIWLHLLNIGHYCTKLTDISNIVFYVSVHRK